MTCCFLRFTTRNNCTLSNRLTTWFVVGLWCVAFSPASAQLTVESLLRSTKTDVSAADYPEIQESISKFQRRDVQGARELLVVAYEKDDTLAPPDIMLAQMYVAANQVNVLPPLLEKVVREHPGDPEAYVILGEIGLRQQRIMGAGLAFDQAFEIGQEYTKNEIRKKSALARIYDGKGRVAEALNDWETAKENYESWVALDGEVAAAHFRLGRAHFELNDEKLAYKAFLEVYKLNDQTTRPEITMARLYHQRSESEADEKKAESLVAKAIQRDGENVRTQLEAAQWYLQKGNIEKAKEASDTARNIDPSFQQAMMLQGVVGRYQKDYVAAEEAFRAAHQQAPLNFNAINQLALSLVEQIDDTEKQSSGLAWAQLATRADSDVKTLGGRDAMITLGYVLHRLGRDTEALRAVQSVLQSGQPSAEGLYFAARILYENDSNVELAKRLLDQLLSNDSSFPFREEAERLQQDM